MILEAFLLRYAFFAVLATLANLATQRGVLWFGDSEIVFAIAVTAGTITGLVLKYMLDKHWIFGDLDAGLKAHGKRFPLYTAMGLVTTPIFWVIETAFWLVWQTDTMRELGALLGLTIGYAVKYNLDRRFVFMDTELERTT